MNKFDDLEAFLHFWMVNKQIIPPETTPTNHNGSLSGCVLYRDGQYQVQLFIVKPNSEIPPHIHPNVDSYEVYLSGDINFMCNDKWFNQNKFGSYIRVKENSYHGGKFGERGGCFLSVQKWLNGVEPTSVGENWHDKEDNKQGIAVEQQPS